MFRTRRRDSLHPRITRSGVGGNEIRDWRCVRIQSMLLPWKFSRRVGTDTYIVSATELRASFGVAYDRCAGCL